MVIGAMFTLKNLIMAALHCIPGIGTAAVGVANGATAPCDATTGAVTGQAVVGATSTATTSTATTATTAINTLKHAKTAVDVANMSKGAVEAGVQGYKTYKALNDPNALANATKNI